MTNQLQVSGITANLTHIDTPIGGLKVLSFVCSEDKAASIIKWAVSKGFPFERTNEGVKIYN